MISRRNFLKRTGGTAMLLAAQPNPAFVWSRSDEMRRIRVALFLDETFPAIDVTKPDGAALRTALSAFDLRIISSADPSKLPAAGDIDVLVTPYGSAFPEEAGEMILGFLAQGGCWINLGGTPLAVPVRWNGKAWQPAARRTAWHRRLGITQSMEVDCEAVEAWKANPQFEGSELLASTLEPTLARGLYLRLTNTKHFADEDGSNGTRDAEIHPLLSGVDAEGLPLVAPVVLIDRLHGPMAGSRQIFYTGNTTCAAGSVKELVAIAAGGAARLSVHPLHARLDRGETTSVIVRLHTSGRAAEGRCVVELLRDGSPIERAEVQLRCSRALPGDQAQLRLRHAFQETGLYELRASLPLPRAGATIAALTSRSAIVVAGSEDFAKSKRIARSGSALTWNGAPLTATGTSYMARDVQRSFLLEPNPMVWDEDFREMRTAGVNLVRTGIWTGWKRMMLQPGAIDEAVLRSIEAFLYVDAQHDIPVIFTVFSFLPESWGGSNPYLDPRSVDAQRSFVAAIVRRCRHFNNVIWDLINEPSFCSPSQLWRCRPNYDEFEVRAWQAWLRKRYGNGDSADFQRRLGDLWRSDTNEYGGLPALDAFEDAHLFGDRAPLKVLDYRLFAQDAFAGWVRELRDTITAAGGGEQLVMVGQDEGGTMDRPNPQFHADVVDATSVHSWWFNDDVLWDSVVTRAPGTPHLVQETGVMMYEAVDGSAWRSEHEAAQLLKRKLLIALSAGSAGYVQWLWHSNPWMASDNEAAIGALRSDGSAKPEYFVLKETALFMRTHAARFANRQEEQVVLILPHSHLFSTRSLAVDATRACVRAMAYGCRMPLRAVSEYRLSESTLKDARLLVLPSAGMIDEFAWQQLLAAVRRGATLLVTGIIDRDEHGHAMPRSASWDVQASQRPVAQSELLELDDEILTCAFRGEKLQRVTTAVVVDHSVTEILREKLGAGYLLWCPLPVELSDTPSAIVALYRTALHRAGLHPAISLDPDASDILVTVSAFEEDVLLGIVNERSSTAEFTLRYKRGPAIRVELPAGGSSMLLLDAKGKRIAQSG